MYSIGIDLGGTNIAGGIVTEDHVIVCKKSIPTNAPRPAQEIADDISKLCLDLCENGGIDFDKISFVGIASPGIIVNGVIETADNLRFYQVPLAKMIAEKLGKKVYLQNDANIAAYAEAILGAGKGKKSMVLITLGTGVGGGIIFDNRIYDGFNGAGAEIGHIIIEAGGEPCPCGKRGCLEAYCSATALIRETKEAMLKDRYSSMWQLCENDLEKVDGKTAFDGMRMNDSTAKLVVGAFIHYLAVGISNVITLLQPELVAIGGGLSRENNYILTPLRTELRKLSMLREDQSETMVTIAEFENDAGIIGASLLGYKDFKFL